MEQNIIETDILIIGGGTAGCLAAVEVRERFPNLRVTIMEKAHIDRSGCLAGGMNAINAYLNPGETPESFVKYVRFDSCGLIREDLVLSMSELFEYCVKKVEKWGLPILCDEKGNYIPRGRWNIKINGESLKPIIAKAAKNAGTKVLNWVVASNYLVVDGRVAGAVGFSVRNGNMFVVKAKATIIATGGAAGVYKPNNAHDAQHKTWYCPYNTGAGYAMGIRAGAEMTSFEMRYIGLRVKDTIAPTGTIALGVGAPQINSKGEKFMATKYAHIGGDGAPTPYRSHGPLQEIKEGRGPVYLDTRHITSQQARDLKSAFLDMYPSMVLYWAANEIDPSKEPVEVQTTEPYIVGGHTQSGYWVDVNRKTTLDGLYAAGDVAGGAPYKFVSGCWAEGVIAAKQAGEYAQKNDFAEIQASLVHEEQDRAFAPLLSFTNKKDGIKAYDMEVRLQKIMEEYAGGAATYYEVNEERLLVARRRLATLPDQFKHIIAEDLHELMKAHEVIDRVYVAQTLVEHMLYRKETRWPGYCTRTDYTERNDEKWLNFVNSRRDPDTGDIEMLTRPYVQIVPGDRYKPR
ncbi:MAG: adenylyl-sulfate reductase subunit alpha [Nitrospirae bacterium]|nr:adenylyl-sulfate reductase subunit alpha [Nitrospirota bacterium]